MREKNNIYVDVEGEIRDDTDMHVCCVNEIFFCLFLEKKGFFFTSEGPVLFHDADNSVARHGRRYGASCCQVPSTTGLDRTGK